jgi:hypothetical protein
MAVGSQGFMRCLYKLKVMKSCSQEYSSDTRRRPGWYYLRDGSHLSIAKLEQLFRLNSKIADSWTVLSY